MKIVALGHQRNVGKDVAAQIMATQLKVKNPGLDIRHVGFADPMYVICQELYGWAGFKSKKYYDTHREEKEEVIDELYKSPRQILIEVGMNFRDIYERTWLDYVLNIEADVVFISDLRFPNEAKALKQAGGYLIKVNRDIAHEISLTDPDNQLLSWTDWDMVIENHGTLQEYAKKIREALDEIPIW